MPAPPLADRRRNTRLAAAIAEDGRPKYKIAAAADLVPQIIGGIISGRVEPTLSARQRLADVLGRAVDELFPGGGSS